MSPRNSVEAICNLIKTTSCRHIVSQAALAHPSGEVQSTLASVGYALLVHDLPSLHDVFPALSSRGHETQAVSHYPSSKKPFSLEDPALYLHSSGSTGLPKAIPHKISLSLRSCKSGTDFPIDLNIPLTLLLPIYRAGSEDGRSPHWCDACAILPCTWIGILPSFPVGYIQSCCPVHASISGSAYSSQCVQRARCMCENRIGSHRSGALLCRGNKKGLLSVFEILLISQFPRRGRNLPNLSKFFEDSKQ